MIKIIGFKNVCKDIFVRFFISVIWRSFFLSKRDKKVISDYENWSHPTDEWEEPKEKGKVSGWHSKTILRIQYEGFKQPIHIKIVRNYKVWKWFLGKDWKWFVRQSIIKHYCKHKNLSEPQWDFSKMQGYTYCHKCWTNFYDPTLTFVKCNCVSEISA